MSAVAFMRGSTVASPLFGGYTAVPKVCCNRVYSVEPLNKDTFGGPAVLSFV